MKQLREELANKERREIVASTKNHQEEPKRSGRRGYFGSKDPTTTSAFVVVGNKNPLCIYWALPHLSTNCAVLQRITSAKPVNHGHVVTTAMADITQVFATLKKYQNNK